MRQEFQTLIDAENEDFE